MNMGFIDSSSAAAVQRQDTAKTMQTGTLSADAQVTGNSEGAFRQMLAHMMGSGKSDQASASGQTRAAELVLQGQLSLLGLEEEIGLEQLLQSLEQLLGAVEQAPPELLAMLQEDPKLAQLMAAFNSSLQVEGSEQHVQARTSPVVTQEIAPQLKEVLQRLITQLSSGHPSQEITDQAKSFEQMLRPILLASQQQVQVQTTGNMSWQQVVQGTTEGSPSISLASLHGASDAVLAGRNGKLNEAANTSQQILINVDPGASGPSAAMLPKATLLRPDLVHLMTGEAAMEVTGETTGDSVQMQMLPLGDALKSVAGPTVPRTAAPIIPQVPAEQFADELSRFVVRSFQVTELNGIAEAKIKLYPEQLGSVDIKLTMNNGQLTAQIVTETLLGREALEQQLGALRAALQQQGIQVERLEVTQQTSLSHQLFKDQGQHGQSARHYNQGQEPKHATATYEDETAEVSWDLELLGEEYEAYVSSRSFHATA